MSLRGALQDFGIADAFSLIGSQSKSGVLQVLSRDEQASIHFVNGAVVRTEATRRQSQDLLGNMLVRAEAIAATQLEEALQRHRGTRKTLGDLLIAMDALSAHDLHVFTRLQSAETVFRIFLWRTGTYEFIQDDAPPQFGHPPLRAETLLMEGFRQADEWPSLRKKLATYAMTFDVLEPLPPVPAAVAGADSISDDFDLAMGLGEAPAPAATSTDRFAKINDDERRVYGLVLHDRDVQKLIDLARLGEFATCKALCNLLDAGLLRPRLQRSQASAQPTVGGIHASGAPAAWRSLVRHVAWGLLALGIFTLLAAAGLPVSLQAQRRVGAANAAPLRQTVLLAQEARIGAALRVYYAAHGSFPVSLEILAQAGLLRRTKALLDFTYHGGGEQAQLERPLF